MSYFRQIGSTNQELRFPINLGEYKDSAQHFMLIKEITYNPLKKSSDPLNQNNSSGIETFNNVISGDETGPYDVVRTFCLYLPQGSLKTSYSAGYDEVKMGFFGDLISQNSEELTTDAKNAFNDYVRDQSSLINRTSEFYSKIGESVSDVAQEGINRYIPDGWDRFKYNASTGIGDLMNSLNFTGASGEDVAAFSMRKQKNPYTSLVFTGIKSLREHTFEFNFRPKNSIESERVLKIITNLKDGMLPSLPNIDMRKNVYYQKTEDNSELEDYNLNKNNPNTEIIVNQQNNISYKVNSIARSAFFNFPNVYTITFYTYDGDTKGNPNLYKIGQSVLTSLTSNYSQIFFNDGAPTEISLNLVFKENFALHRDYIEEGY
jgi:hypothetical protein